MPVFGKSSKKTDGAKAEADARLQIQRLENEAAAAQKRAEAELQRIKTFQQSGNKKAALSGAQRYKEQMDTMNSLLNQANTIRKGIQAKQGADRSRQVLGTLDTLNKVTQQSLKEADVGRTTTAISNLATNVETSNVVTEILEGDVLTDEPTEDEEAQLDDIINLAMGTPTSTTEQPGDSVQNPVDAAATFDLPKIPRDTEVAGPTTAGATDNEKQKKLLEKLAKKKQELKED